MILREMLGVRYERHLVPVPVDCFPALRNAVTGEVLPVQRAPVMPFDATEAPAVNLLLADIEPGQTLDLVHVHVEVPVAIRVAPEGDHLVITNGRCAVRVPAEGLLEQPFPGPIEAVRLGNGPWLGRSTLVDIPHRGHVNTVVESLGPCCVQWATTYRWGSDAAYTVRVRWATGSDTLEIVEEATEDTDAAVEWLPLAPERATAHIRGGGEGKGPMQRLEYRTKGDARKGHGRRRLQSVSHISYWNQWNLSWVGFPGADGFFVGIFSEWGGLWQRRGVMRMDVIEDDELGHLIRSPIRRGRRFYGVVVATRNEAAMDSADMRCLLNHRKTEHSDLPVAKVAAWQLDSPLEKKTPHLVSRRDMDTFRERLAGDPRIVEALETGWRRSKEVNGRPIFAAAFWKKDEEGMRACAKDLERWAEDTLTDVADGGFDRLIIFDGRRAKSVAYDLDCLWAEGLLEESAYRKIRRTLLALAYMFADPGYCRYGDFWPQAEPEERIAAALKDDMGDCPVPPNFASEFFSTTGVMAELFPSHPLRDAWRRWSLEQTDRFWETFFETDGTYHESVNYHSHGFNEMLCHLYPLYVNGVRDYFAAERVKGSFRHFVEILMPPLCEGVALPDTPAPLNQWKTVGHVYADWNMPRRSPMPCDGNSGGEGMEQELAAELALGASVYRESDPKLAGNLMHAWSVSGRLILDNVHPLLTLVTLDPSVPAVKPAEESRLRKSLGIISRARRKDGAPVWCLFRAGGATHHMDFDQGNVHLAAWDRILLGDHGYHTHDTDGKGIPACATWLHSTLTYSADRGLASGYTGLERAPEPTLVHLSDDFDWCVHRIVTRNFRDLEALWYSNLVPTAEIVHVRHYLFVKPDYFLLWDVFEKSHEPSTFWLHPRAPMVRESATTFRAGRAGEPHLFVQFILPKEPEVMENAQRGPLWSLAVRNETGASYLVLLAPQKEDRAIMAVLDSDGRTVHVTGDGLQDVLRLPTPGHTRELPRIQRR